MTLTLTERAGKSQIGYCTNTTTGYAEAGGDLTFATGLIGLSRMKIEVPRGATINSATLSMEVVAKQAGTAQTSYNSVRAHASGDSPILKIGELEGQRPWTAAQIAWTLVWPVNPSSAVIANLNVLTIVNEIVARSDYQPGGYITFQLLIDNENGSDLSVRANNDFAMSWQLVVDYTENYRDLKCDINLLNNPNLEELPQIDSTPLPFWGQNTFFGGHVDPANQGTIARDTSFTRVAGVPTLRFTCGTPPPAEQSHKRTGPMTVIHRTANHPYIFGGWIYVSPDIPAGQSLDIGDYWMGYTQVSVSTRGAWVPFCSNPTSVGAYNGREALWPTLGLRGPYVAGWQFWISEPFVMLSSFKQMPFNGNTPDPQDPNAPLIDHKRIGSGQGAVREWVPRTAVVRGGVVKRVPRYTKRADGILQLAEPVRGGPQVQNLAPGVTVANLPATITSSEL